MFHVLRDQLVFFCAASSMLGVGMDGKHRCRKPRGWRVVIKSSRVQLLSDGKSTRRVGMMGADACREDGESL